MKERLYVRNTRTRRNRALSFLSVGLSVAVCLFLAVFFGFKGWPSRP